MAAQPTTSGVWSHLSDDLRRFIRRRVADDHTADDLLQETFVLIHQNIHRLVNADRIAAWVYRIAQNVVLGHYRKSGHRSATLGDADPAAVTADSQSRSGCRPDEWLDELIRQLPESYREAVQLAEIDGFTQRAVADRLGLSVSGAKSRIQRGRGMLKDALEQCCHFEFDRRGNVSDCTPKPDTTVCRNCGD